MCPSLPQIHLHAKLFIKVRNVWGQFFFLSAELLYDEARGLSLERFLILEDHQVIFREDGIEVCDTFVLIELINLIGLNLDRFRIQQVFDVLVPQ